MKKDLNDEEKYIMFEGGTEPAFSGKHLTEKRGGKFLCKNCGAELFDSTSKFESGSGWPSFTEPKDEQNITITQDLSHGMVRTEVKCKNCNAHLGHVFDDGPVDRGGKRYCINSICLDFDPWKEI